jgi:hypothetical protein
MMVASNEGFALWARSSDAALKSGRFIRTKDTVFELPAAASAKRRLITEETMAGLVQPAEAWEFPEGLVEMCIRSERYDQEITLLHFEGSAPIFFREEADLEDTYDRFVNNGQAPVMPCDNIAALDHAARPDATQRRSCPSPPYGRPV